MGDLELDEALDQDQPAASERDVARASFLLLGGEDPRCEAPGDGNDDGTMDIADAIFILNHLFLGGPEPPPPYPEPGRDPTSDDLDCRGY